MGEIWNSDIHLGHLHPYAHHGSFMEAIQHHPHNDKSVYENLLHILNPSPVSHTSKPPSPPSVHSALPAFPDLRRYLLSGLRSHSGSSSSLDSLDSAVSGSEPSSGHASTCHSPLIGPQDSPQPSSAPTSPSTHLYHDPKSQKQRKGSPPQSLISLHKPASQKQRQQSQQQQYGILSFEALAQQQKQQQALESQFQSRDSLSSLISDDNDTQSDNSDYSESSGDRFKTEMCRSFIESGQCRYGGRCRFAHGWDDLRQVQRHSKYKSELCRRFHGDNTDMLCPYGNRCCFTHTVREMDIVFLNSLPSSISAVVTASKSRSRLPCFRRMCSSKDTTPNPSANHNVAKSKAVHQHNPNQQQFAPKLHY